MNSKPNTLDKAKTKAGAKIPPSDSPAVLPAPLPLSPPFPFPLELGVAGVLELLSPPPEVVDVGAALIPPSPYGHPINSVFGDIKQVNPAAVPLMN
jgi:hypothetical protein